MIIFFIFLNFLSLFKSGFLIKLLPLEYIQPSNEPISNITYPIAFENYNVKENLLSYNETSTSYLGISSYGLFMNVSYSSIFLKVSLSHSLIYLFLSNQTLNVSNFKYTFYSANDESCWPLMETDSDYCLSKFFIKDKRLNHNDLIEGYIGKDFAVLNKKYINIQNIVYLNNSNIQNEPTQGIFGLGYSENEGVYGLSWIEELVGKGIINKPRFSFCFDQEKSYLVLGNDDKVRYKQNLHYYDQFHLFDFGLKIDSIIIENRLLNKDVLSASINIDAPFILLPENIMEAIIKNLVAYLCYNNRDDSANFFMLKEKVCRNFRKLFLGDSLSLSFNEFTIILQYLPNISITLYDDGLKRKYVKKIRNYLRTCPNTQNLENFIKFHSNATQEFDICSYVLINYRKKNNIELGNFFFNKMYVSFDLSIGKIGITEIDNCEEEEMFTDENSLLWIEIFYCVISFLSIFLISLLGINKCDNYFHDDYEIVIEEEDEDENNNSQDS